MYFLGKYRVPQHVGKYRGGMPRLPVPVGLDEAVLPHVLQFLCLPGAQVEQLHPVASGIYVAVVPDEVFRVVGALLDFFFLPGLEGYFFLGRA